jgi:hypothetical protein
LRQPTIEAAGGEAAPAAQLPFLLAAGGVPRNTAELLCVAVGRAALRVGLDGSSRPHTERPPALAAPPQPPHPTPPHTHHHPHTPTPTQTTHQQRAAQVPRVKHALGEGLAQAVRAPAAKGTAAAWCSSETAGWQGEKRRRCPTTSVGGPHSAPLPAAAPPMAAAHTHPHNQMKYNNIHTHTKGHTLVLHKPVMHHPPTTRTCRSAPHPASHTQPPGASQRETSPAASRRCSAAPAARQRVRWHRERRGTRHGPLCCDALWRG